MARRSNFSIYPRYAAGSPAMVPEETCRRAFNDEQQAYERTLEGIYGPEEVSRARELGLAGIAIERWECRNKVFSRDLHTGDITSHRMRLQQRPR